MDIQSIISVVTAALSVAQKAYAIGKDIAPILLGAYNLLVKGKHATQADVDALRKQSDALSAELQAPIPPEEE